MTATLVPVSQIGSLPDEYREHALTIYLTEALDRLTCAHGASGPEAVASIKAELVTVAEMARQLDLSKECRDYSTKMVRRAEWTLGKAIRKGQAEGTIAKMGDRATIKPYVRVRHGREEHIQPRVPNASDKLSPSDFMSNGQEHSDIYTMASATSDEFDAALDEAKAEGNLSRANVVRKVKGLAGVKTRSQRADKIRDLAAQGYTAEQMAPTVGIAANTIRIIARDFDIDLSADRVRGKRQRIDPLRVIENVTEAIEAATFSLRQIDPSGLGSEESHKTVDSLTSHLKALAREVKKIKESL